MSSVHVHEVTSLESYAAEIETLLDKTVLEVGAILARALQEHGVGDWTSWVEHYLPFTSQKAEQLVAIHEAFSRLPAGLLKQLPRPYQALFALRRLTQDELEDAIEQFELGPSTSVRRSRRIVSYYRTGPQRSVAPRSANIRAAKLMERTAGELDPMVRASLERWLTR